MPRLVPALLCALFASLSAAASAADAADAPADPDVAAQPDVVTDAGAAGPEADLLPPLAVPGLDAAEEELMPPAVDAYVDISFTGADIDEPGFDDTARGYRIIAGFRLLDVAPGGWSVAPEIGYWRLGRSERVEQALFPNSPLGFDRLQTDTYTLNATALDFGARFDRRLLPRLDAYARTGLAVTHVQRKREVLNTYLPRDVTPPDECPVFAPTCSLNNPEASTTEVSIDPWLGLGLALELGIVPSLYGEYNLRTVDGQSTAAWAVGFLLNF